ncbi:MAG: type II toxin-antitoxin system VapB family antitoxin [Angustibacter sp.]
MAMNIKDPEAESLAAEVAALAGENKTQAVRTALRERRARLKLTAGQPHDRTRLRDVLEKEIWPLVPEHEVGRRLDREEEDQILGFGPEGV